MSFEVGFEVGVGVAAKMAELGDTPHCSSVFTTQGKRSVEWGIGKKNLYHATNIGNGEWFTEVEPLNPSAAQVSDLRGQLPVRAGAAKYPTRPVAAVDTLCVHYTAAPPERTVYDIATYQTTVQTGDLFPEIAYHFYIEKDGVIRWCHDFNRRVWGSGQPGMNERAVHVCYSGDYEPNPAQLAGLRRARAFVETALGRQPIVVGHRSGYATQCPGPTMATWLPSV